MLVRLLALPVTGPVQGMLWVLNQILAAAEAELGGARAREEIAEAQEAYERGEIDEEELSRRLDSLLDQVLMERADEHEGD